MRNILTCFNNMPFIRDSKFLKNEQGITSIEYALISGLIALAIISSVSSVGSAVNGAFNKVADQMSGKTESVATATSDSGTGNTGNTVVRPENTRHFLCYKLP